MPSRVGSGSSTRSALAELLRPDSPIQRVATEFARAGHELYLVGGAVRDALLKRRGSRQEFDFATDATPDVTKTVLEPFASAVWLQGERFGTVGARVSGVDMEITTFRTERYQPSSRHPDVSFTPDIRTDLSRRDFTINALALHLVEKRLIDLFNGVGDLEQRLLKTPVDPRDSFGDDPLRMLRAFRFASELDFRIAPDTLAAIEEMKPELANISAERIRDELSKLLVGAAPGRSLAVAESVGLTHFFLPELSSLKLEQDPVHRHKDVFTHTLAVVERTAPDVELRLAALLHDVGKPKTRKIGPDGVSFHHHEVVGAKIAEARLRALRYPNHMVANVSEAIRLHHRFHTYRLGWNDSAVRRYVRDAGPILPLVNALVRADCTTRNQDKARRLAQRMDELEERIRELAAQEEIEKLRPELDGHKVMSYLGVQGGPVIGRAMEFLLEIRLDEGLIGADEAYRRLDAWARDNGIDPAGERVPPKEKKKKDPGTEGSGG
ncbi:MAG: CCA tRNA nucleotidyltransferase [Actinomycetota bacterium]|nr:CCA tRNA nucleotidyltransferase [Actinomycetota bacterium]